MITFSFMKNVLWVVHQISFINLALYPLPIFIHEKWKIGLKCDHSGMLGASTIHTIFLYVRQTVQHTWTRLNLYNLKINKWTKMRYMKGHLINFFIGWPKTVEQHKIHASIQNWQKSIRFQRDLGFFFFFTPVLACLPLHHLQ